VNCVIVFICQQRQLVRIQAMTLVLQTRRVPQVAGLELLRLLTSTTPTEAPSKSHSELSVEFGNSYWLILFGVVLVLSGFYKVWGLCSRWWPNQVSDQVTRSSLILRIFYCDYGLYIRVLQLDGVHSQLVITSKWIIDNLVLVGCILPLVGHLHVECKCAE